MKKRAPKPLTGQIADWKDQLVEFAAEVFERCGGKVSTTMSGTVRPQRLKFPWSTHPVATGRHRSQSRGLVRVTRSPDRRSLLQLNFEPLAN